MASQHEISDFIENLPLQKTFCKGYRPDEVYEVICNLSSMYNQLLCEALVENEELRNRMENIGLEEIQLEEPKQPEEEIHVELTEEEETTEEATEEAAEKVVEKAVEEAAREEKVRFMTDKELQKLKRRDLLEILLEQSKQNDEMELRLEEKDEMIRTLNRKLEEKRINLEKAGTIAEASFQMNGVLEAAEKAAKQYLDNIELLHEKEKYLYSVKEKEVEERCSQMLKKTQEECECLIRTAEERCQYLDQKAKEDVDMRWKELSRRLEEFYQSHTGLRELLASTKMI